MIVLVTQVYSKDNINSIGSNYSQQQGNLVAISQLDGLKSGLNFAFCCNLALAVLMTCSFAVGYCVLGKDRRQSVLTAE